MSYIGDQVRKVVIIGLDQAGKTSILNMLNQEYNLLDNIKPTMGVNRKVFEILGFQIVSFDLGGQERFRDGYLSDTKIFEQTDTLIFVIDAMNATRYQEALHYYEEIVNVFDKLKLKPKIVLCIHKIDPNLRFDHDTLDIIEEVKDLFVPVSKGYDLTVFVTSIYDRSSIVRAFSRNLQDLIATIKPLKPTLQSLVGLLKLDGAIIFDEKLMIIAEHFQDVQAEELCYGTVYNSVSYMSQQNPNVSQNIVVNFEIVLGAQNVPKRFNFIEMPYKSWNLYLLTMGNEKLYPKTLLTKFNSIIRLHEI